MIGCSKIKEKISPFLDEELSTDERLLVEQHLQICDACRREYMDMKIISKIMRSLDIVEPPPDFHARLEKRLLGARRGHFISLASRLNRSWLSLGAVAAGLLLVVASWGLLFGEGLPKWSAHQRGAFDQAAHQEEASPAESDAEIQPFSLALEEDSILQEESGQRDTYSESAEGKDTQSAPDPVPEVEQFSIASPNKETSQEPFTERDASEKPIGATTFQAIPSVTETESGQQDTSDDKAINGHGDLQVARGATGQQGSATDNGDASDKTNSQRGIESEEIIYRTALIQTIPDDSKGPRIVLEIETEVLADALIEADAIVRQNGLQMETVSANDTITIEIQSPTPKQKKVVEKLKGIGHVNKEDVFNLDIDATIAELTNWQNGLLQRQSELEALIRNGGSFAEAKAWKDELTEVTKEIKDIQKKIIKLEKNQATTSISLKLIKPNK